MSDAVKRGLRTFVQAFLGAILTSGVLGAVVDTGTVDLSALQTVAVSAFAAGVIGLLSFVQNALEDSSGTSVLK